MMQLVETMDSRFSAIEIQQGELWFAPSFFTTEESDQYFDRLLHSIKWRQEDIQLFGKTYQQPRLIAWHGDEDMNYSYSGLALSPESWTAELARLRDILSEACGCEFNSVLLNLYRHGQDSMGWHSDDEKELGPQPVIASLSFGGSRKFHLKHKQDTSQEPIHLTLAHGSLLVMKGDTQKFWKHQVPKTRKNVKARINLTFRKIYSG